MKRDDRRPAMAASRTERFGSLCSQLKPFLIHTRIIPNGSDFLFDGPEEAIHPWLESLAGSEYKKQRGVSFDVVRIDEYFLLRVVGPGRMQLWIRQMFV